MIETHVYILLFWVIDLRLKSGPEVKFQILWKYMKKQSPMNSVEMIVLLHYLISLFFLPSSTRSQYPYSISHRYVIFIPIIQRVREFSDTIPTTLPQYSNFSTPLHHSSEDHCIHQSQVHDSGGGEGFSSPPIVKDVIKAKKWESNQSVNTITHIKLHELKYLSQNAPNKNGMVMIGERVYSLND